MKKNELKIVNSLYALSRRQEEPREILRQITAALNRITHSERCVLYMAPPGENRFLLAAETAPAGEAASPAEISGETLARLRREFAAASKCPGITGLAPAWDPYPCAVVVPFSYLKRSGKLFLFSRHDERLKALSLSFFTMLGETIALIVEDIGRGVSLRCRLDEGKLLLDISHASYATLEVEPLLSQVARHISVSLGGESGHITLKPGAESSSASFRCSWPHPPEEACASDCFDGVHRKVIDGGAPVVDMICRKTNPADNSVLYLSGFPIQRRQAVIGSAIFLHRRPFADVDNASFSEDRRPFLTSLSSQVSMAVTNALNNAEAVRLAHESRNRARELAILFEISQVLGQTMSLDQVLRTILTAATFGHGLSFNRGALYLVNEKTNTLQGMMGVGPENAQEAYRIWGELSSRDWELSEALSMSLNTPISNALNAAVKSIRIPITFESGVLALAVIEKRAFNITDARTDPRVNRATIEKLNSNSFAVAPMIAEGKVLGVLAVDNLYNNRPITDRDVQLLSTFANQAALAINTAQLIHRLKTTNDELKGMYRRLSQAERLATLGEMAATVAHEVRNPLVSVGGFARRLEKRLDKNDPNRHYAEIILKEITRLEKFLNEILVFSREIQPVLGPTDLNKIIREITEFFSLEMKTKKINVDIRLADDLPLIQADAEQLSQILVNFYTNSLDALSGGGTINIISNWDEDGQSIGLIFADDGGGVPEDILCNIFNPFFTTKSSGTGLGLPLVKKIVKNHQGTIEIDNKPGRSLSFIIRLPIQPELPASANKEGENENNSRG